MSTDEMQKIRNRWLTFLMHTELAKNHKMANMIASGGQPPAPNPIVDRLLPSLLYVRLGALLDETFEDFITAKGLAMPRRYRNDFNGRITFLDDQGLLKYASRLHTLRQKRNEVAHEPSSFRTWSELEDAVAIAQTELAHLSLVGDRPVYEFYAQRNPRQEPERGYLITFDYRYGLKVDGKRAIEVSWTRSYGGIEDS
jgi:hypothetical protein